MFTALAVLAVLAVGFLAGGIVALLTVGGVTEGKPNAGHPVNTSRVQGR